MLPALAAPLVEQNGPYVGVLQGRDDHERFATGREVGGEVLQESGEHAAAVRASVQRKTSP
jgi:hypothetical protein